MCDGACVSVYQSNYLDCTSCFASTKYVTYYVVACSDRINYDLMLMEQNNMNNTVILRRLRRAHCDATAAAVDVVVAAVFYENSKRAASALLRASARSTDSVRAARRALRSSSTKH